MLNSLKTGTLEEKTVIDQFMANLDDTTCDTFILIDGNISLKTAETLIRRDNLPFKLLYDSQSKQLFAYELNGNEQRESVLSVITRQIYIYTLDEMKIV
jgi:hypothetical protein